jgi:hypothetical protein
MRPLVTALEELGQPMYGCPTPDGWAHTQVAWLNPDALAHRIGFADDLASGRLPLGQAIAPDRRQEPSVATAAAGSSSDAMAAPRTSDDGSGQIAGSMPPVDARRLLDTLGPAVGEATRIRIAESAEPLRATLALGSPDFMRR